MLRLEFEQKATDLRFIKIILAILAFSMILMQGQVIAQKKVLNLPTYDYSKYHFGFILGLNQLNFVVRTNDNLSQVTYDSTQSPDIFADSLRILSIDSDPTLGFTIGIVGNLRLGKYFDLRFIPSLSFGERYLNYTFLRYFNGTQSVVDIKKSVTSTFVDFPLEIKYKSKRIGNYRAYVMTGFKYTMDLATNKSKKADDPNSTLVRLNKNDFSIEGGVGFDFYNAWFKFGIELKMSYGLTDVLVREDNVYTSGIDKLSSKMFQVSFTFE